MPILKETIPLGSTVTDKVTGFKGVLQVRVNQSSGLEQYIMSGQHVPILGKSYYSQVDEAQLVVDKTVPLIETRPLQPILKGFEFGAEAVDRYSGFKGLIVAFEQHLNGCIQVMLQPSATKDGKLPSTETFNINNLDITKKPKKFKQQKPAEGCIGREVSQPVCR